MPSSMSRRPSSEVRRSHLQTFWLEQGQGRGQSTKFKKRKATVVESSRFLSKPKAVHMDEHGFFENKELTKVHQRLHQSLRRVNSQEKVLSIIKEEKGFLSTSNRVVALTRLASLDRSAECARDPRVEELLK